MTEIAATEYTVKLPSFEGPLDLLLHLIKVNELEITEISISQITSQYLEYLRLMEKLDLEIAGEFIVMAATLLNIKLRSLLPTSEEEAEEESAELDDFVSARALMQRLIEYRRFKEAGQGLGRRFEHQSQVFMREVALPKMLEAEQDSEYRGDMEKLMEAFTRVLRFVDRKPFHAVQGEEFHVEDKITMLRRAMLIEPRVSLMEVFKACRARLEMIVTLIAVLEMCRLKEVGISQPDIYGDALIYRRETEPDLIEQSERNEELAREEQEILANRTGIVDDGVTDELDELDAEEEALLHAASDEASADPAPLRHAEIAHSDAIERQDERFDDAEDDESAAPSAEIIDLTQASDAPADESVQPPDDFPRQ